ncbi:hypothetical protein RDWZM_010350 [Blomia tropicalis]|uniref:Ig-like domain-containing protein n=1 Tax=Blomia tropicalis TaxID=40697 RepID=A0A9Q0LYB3_BLOTA|nr:hypothetical protein RDWZM_010350 [Blomia tropicalis]
MTTTFIVYHNFVDGKVKIQQIKVPKYVENGTSSSVVLDCIYTMNPEEDFNLVVKWFFNEDSEPIYQWIAEFNSRHVPQRYEGRVNPNYQVPNNSDPWQRHRALMLLRPTVDLNGRYSCHVISIMSQDSAEATMIVYVNGGSSTQTEIECSVQNVYPLPELTIYQVETDGLRPRSLQNARLSQNITKLPNGAFSVSVTVYVDDTELLHQQQMRPTTMSPTIVSLKQKQQQHPHYYPPNSGQFVFGHHQSRYHPNNQVTSASSSMVNGHQIAPTIFECLVSQDEIRHEQRKRMLYTPILDDETGYNANSSTIERSSMSFIILCTSFAFIVLRLKF